MIYIIDHYIKNIEFDKMKKFNKCKIVDKNMSCFRRECGK